MSGFRYFVKQIFSEFHDQQLFSNNYSDTYRYQIILGNFNTLRYNPLLLNCNTQDISTLRFASLRLLHFFVVRVATSSAASRLLHSRQKLQVAASVYPIDHRFTTSVPFFSRNIIKLCKRCLFETLVSEFRSLVCTSFSIFYKRPATGCRIVRELSCDTLKVILIFAIETPCIIYLCHISESSCIIHLSLPYLGISVYILSISA